MEVDSFVSPAGGARKVFERKFVFNFWPLWGLSLMQLKAETTEDFNDWLEMLSKYRRPTDEAVKTLADRIRAQRLKVACAPTPWYSFAFSNSLLFPLQGSPTFCAFFPSFPKIFWGSPGKKHPRFPRSSLRAQRLKKFNPDWKISISLEYFNLVWNFQPRPSEFPT